LIIIVVIIISALVGAGMSAQKPTQVAFFVGLTDNMGPIKDRQQTPVIFVIEIKLEPQTTHIRAVSLLVGWSYTEKQDAPDSYIRRRN